MKSKFKVKQLAAVPAEFELVHPKHGDTGIMIKMRGPHSEEWRTAYEKYKENPDTEANLDLMVAALVDWDAEAFDEPFTPEAAKKLLADASNEWIALEIVKHLWDTTEFFQ